MTTKTQSASAQIIEQVTSEAGMQGAGVGKRIAPLRPNYDRAIAHHGPPATS